MPELKFPRRRRDDSGNWKVEMPFVDPAAKRRSRKKKVAGNPASPEQEIDSCKRILSATYNDGFPVYVAELRTLAEIRLQELGITEEEAINVH